MRGFLVVAALAAVVAVGAPAASPATASGLRIVVWPEGPGERSFARTLRCDPAGGTLRRPVDACRRLAQLERPFAPVPRDVACTQIFGGMQEARVTGTYRGRRIWVRFNRRDGCQIARWNRHAFLFAG